jgi:putative zinc finger/helix-turn-helix YgiT family protein
MEHVNCPVCDSNEVREEIFSNRMTHRGTAFDVPNLKSMRCSHCGTSFYGDGHAEHNRQQVLRAKAEKVLGVTPQWICAFRKRMNLTQGEAGRIFGGGKIAFSRYEAGDVTPSQALVRLLLVSDRLPGAMEMLRRIAADESAVAPLLSPDELLETWGAELKSSFEYEGVLRMLSANQSDFDGADLKDAA